MNIEESKEVLTNQYEEIVEDVKKGEYLSANMVRVMLNLKSASDLADLYWSKKDYFNYKTFALLAYKYYKIKDTISDAMQEKFNYN